MNMLPKSERRTILKKAYSIRWMAAAFILTMLEATAGFLGTSLIPGPSWVVALAVGFIVAGAFVARLMSQNLFQKDSHEDGTPDY